MCQLPSNAPHCKTYKAERNPSAGQDLGCLNCYKYKQYIGQYTALLWQSSGMGALQQVQFARQLWAQLLWAQSLRVPLRCF